MIYEATSRGGEKFFEIELKFFEMKREFGNRRTERNRPPKPPAGSVQSVPDAFEAGVRIEPVADLHLLEAGICERRKGVPMRPDRRMKIPAEFSQRNG